MKMAQIEEKNLVISGLRQEALELKFKINEINQKFKTKETEHKMEVQSLQNQLNSEIAKSIKFAEG